MKTDQPKALSAKTADRLSRHAVAITWIATAVRQAGHDDIARQISNGVHTLTEAISALDQLHRETKERKAP